MKRLLIYIILSILLESCIHVYFVAPGYLKNEGFSFRYIEDKTNLNELLNINGYYTTIDNLNSGCISCTNMNLLFFDDGMFVSGFANRVDSNHNEIGKVIPRYIDNVIEKRNDGIRDASFYKYSNWGYYQLFSDTIKIQQVHRPWFMDMDYNWYAYEIWFKIIDRNNIVEINHFPIHKISDSDLKSYYEREKLKPEIKAYFRPLHQLPKSDGWLKYSKWFWNYKDEYKKWIKDSK